MMDKSQALEQLNDVQPTADDIEALISGDHEPDSEELINQDPDEDGADSGEQEQESEQDEVEQDEPEQPEVVDWKSQEFEVNGEKVSGAELASGYMKDADYRQKTAQAAQLRRDAEQLMQTAQNELSQRANKLDVLANALYQEIVGDQSQLASLVESDPAEYLRRSHYLAQRNQLLQQAMAEREAVGRQKGEYEHRQLAEYVRDEQEKLHAALPEWRDTKVAESEGKELAEYLMGTGFGADELSELYDHRALILARKAMLYDKRASLKPAVQKQSVNVKPGAPQQTNSSQKSREKLKARAIRSNSRDDFTSAIEAYL